MHQFYLQQMGLPDPAERIAALEALSVREDDLTFLIEAAVHSLADPDPGVREYAARLLVDHAGETAAARTAPLIAHTDIAVRNLAGEVLAAMGRPAIDALVPYLDAADKDVRKFALDVLALLPAAPAAPYIALRLVDADPNVRFAAIDALGSLRASTYAPDLRAMYAREPLARPGIVAALGAMGGTRNQAFITAALDDPDPVVQLAAAEALAAFDDPALRDVLLDRAGTVHPLAQSVVLASIVRLHRAHPRHRDVLPAHVRPMLEAMLDDPDPEYRRAAVAGLRDDVDAATVDRLLEHAGADDAVDVEILAALSTCPEAFMRLLQATYDERIAVPTAVEFTLALTAGRAIPEEELADVARFLCTHFRVLDADLKLAAVNVSQRLAHPALHSVVQAGMQDVDPAVTAFAQDAARRLGLALPAARRTATPILR